LIQLSRISDIIHFLHTLSVRKTVNALKIYWSYTWSAATRKAVLLGKPYSMSVEPVNFCNLACPECPAGAGQLTRRKQSMDLRLFARILEETAPDLMYLMLYFQGEPYLHRRIFELIHSAVRYRVYTAISTNAQMISDDFAERTVRSGLHRIIISMDGTTQDVYEAYRRKGSLDRVLEGIAGLRKWRKQLKSNTPYIIVQFIVFRTNQHQLAEIHEFAKKAGADKVVIKTAQLYNFENGNPLMTDIGRYSRYGKMPGGHYAVKNKQHNRCFRLWSGTVITASGDVVPCCFDKDADMVMGNLATQPLHRIWNNICYMQFRQNILNNRKGCKICRNCTEG
jgi:radical SAM protein with 4Fe4S-binding SPASM domain